MSNETMMSLAEAADILGGQLEGGDVRFAAVGTDTRRLAPRSLFVALRGPRFDAHDFVAQAEAGGAAAALVERPVDAALPQLVVPDTLAALGRLAAAWRRRFTPPMIGITGSNGKTTTKEMLASIVARQGDALVTAGNLNNDIGVPLTLLRLRAHHRAAVIEMGANHAGEIRQLAAMAAPEVRLVTNAAAAHLAGFGSLEGVARAKGELYEGLSERHTAVINADDAHAPLWRALAGPARVLTFGLEKPADVGGRWESTGQGSLLRLTTPAGPCELRLALPGRHNVMNALAATAAALAAGAALRDVVAGLEAVAPVRGRLERKRGAGGAVIIDDTYNANPASLAAALEVLSAGGGERLLALGDMGELGPDAAALHRQAGEAARRAGVSRLYALGELSRHAAKGFGPRARHFTTMEELIEALRQDWHADATLLVKGSRRMGMERLVEALSGGDE